MPTSYYSKISHFFHHHKKIKENTSLYITNTLRSIAVSLVGVYLPIYIYKVSENYATFSSNIFINGFSWILFYFLIRSLCVWLAQTLFSKMIFNKLHFQFSIVLSFVFLIIQILLWHLAENNLYLILLSGIFAGLDVVFYWVPYHLFFIRKAVGGSQGFGKSTSLRWFLDRVFGAATPLIGGLLITYFGFNFLFFTSLVLIVISAFPIVFVVQEWSHKEHRIKDVFKNFVFNKKYNKNTYAFLGEGIEALIYAIFWPLLLYFSLQNFIKIGSINSISLILSSFTILYFGKLIDKKGTKKIHIFGSVMNAILYFPRILFNSVPIFYALDISDRFISATYSLPMISLTYKKAHDKNGSDYILYREFVLHFGILISVFLAFLIVYFLPNWRLVFLVPLVGSLLTIFIEYQKD